MAFQTEIEKGQITPAARPVDAFIQPSQQNVAQPSAPSSIGNPSGVSTIGTAGTPSVQGRNSYSDLAEALAPFNRNLMEALQSAGLMYAKGQIDAGERYAKEQVLRAIANTDGAMEASELDRARTNRQVGAKDPNAGEFMAMLNPYFGMGVERGNAKMAAQKAELGLPAYINENKARIDYSAPDMGFGALARLQAEYTNLLAQEYGLSAGSAGFQKYTLPSLEKAQDKVQAQLLKDRKDYYDNTAVSQATTLIHSVYVNSKSGSIEFNGQTYTRARDGVTFDVIVQMKARLALENLVLRASGIGEASERTEKVYRSLAAMADYAGDSAYRSFVDGLPGTEVAKNENGKAIIDPKTNLPERLRMGDQFALTSVDTEIKYAEAAVRKRERTQRDLLEKPADGFDDVVLRAASGPEGPERQQRVDAAVIQWWEKNGREQGISLSELQKRRREIVKTSEEIYAEGSDPDAPDKFWARFDSSLGSSFDGRDWRQQIEETGARILDPEQRAAFKARAREAVASRERELATVSNYARSRDEVLKGIINSNLAEWYDVNSPALSEDEKRWIAESKRLQTTALTERANVEIGKQEAKLGRRLSDTEVRQITRASFYGDSGLGIAAYGKGDGSKREGSTLDYLFPGSQKSSRPGTAGPLGVDPGRQYKLSELGSIPDKRAYASYKNYLILEKQATLDAWKMVREGQTLPRGLQEAWSKGGAKSPGEWVLAQLDLWRAKLQRSGARASELAPFSPSQQERQRVLADGRRAAAAASTVRSIASNVLQNPFLSQLGGSVLNALTGSAPAAAATLDAAPPQYRGGRPPQRQAYPLPTGGAEPAAPAAPSRQRPSAGGSLPPSGSSRPSSAAVALTPPAVSGSSESAPVAPMPSGAMRESGVPGFYLDASGTPFAAIAPQRVASSSRIVAPRRIDSFGSSGGFEKPVSVVYERPGGQPGVDLYFPSKRFPAVLGGVVKDVSQEPGYGNYVVVESVDPLTGQKVDVLYGHLADGVQLRPGQRVEAGQIVGQQGGTGNVRSADGTIASIDFFAPRPAGSRDMTPYSGFDRLRRHVVQQLQSGSGGSAAGNGRAEGYLKRLAYLETRIRNIPNAEGSPGRGYFQAFPKFSSEAIAASGGIDPRDSDYTRSARSTWAWIQKHRPDAAAAIKRGDYETADRILRSTWPSLPGGSQAQPDYVQRQALRYLDG